MNTTDFKKFVLKIYKKTLLISIIFSILFWIFSFTFPKSYITEGTFILTPNFEYSKNESQKSIYNYDGYYLDQVSQGYSKTIIGLIETPEFKKKISEELRIENSVKELFSLNLSTNFKEIAPRVLVLTVKSTSKENSEKMFSIYEKQILYFSDRYNSDKVFKLERLDNFVNTFENSFPNYLYFISTFFLSFTAIILFFYLKEIKDVK